MKHTLKLAGVLLLALFLSHSGGFSQSAGAPEFRESDPIPLDPDVRTGTLPNGMKYYIRKNTEPENRAELRLAVNAGSMQENEDQQGLAHFVEHMAFNGTEHFAKSELVDYLESVGTKFGPHLNAYTSFDETVYMLQIPTDDPEILDNGFTIMQDWAGGVAFEHEEIDKERGVVIEEWRLGQGANERMRKEYFPVAFKDSRYADRLPIGKKEILENFDYQTVKDFYRDWYRPNLMSVVAVGDLDLDATEKMIKEKFGKLSNPSKERQRELYPVPDHKETLVAVATDPETPQTLVQIWHKYDRKEWKTVADYRKELVNQLFSTMLTNRMMELTRSGEPPFVAAFNFDFPLVRAKSTFASFSIAKPEAIENALRTMLRETERARQHGFTATELERTKKEMMKQVESLYKEKDNMESRNMAMEYVQHFLSARPSPGIAMEYEMHKQFLPEITIEEVNKMVPTLARDENMVVVVTAPERDGLDIPSEKDIRNILAEVKEEKVEPYVDKVDDGPLVKTTPTKGNILETSTDEKLGVVTWKLKNGAKVIFKQTDFKRDEILFRAFSPGGSSRYPVEDYYSAANADGLMNESGLGRFDATSLEKKLTGKKVNLTPIIAELYEGFRGDCSPEDLETLLQLVYLNFTAPRKDSEAFDSYVQVMKGFYATQGASPENAFRDSLRVTLANHHPRRPPMTAEMFDKIDLNRAFNIFYDRFNDASDFTFLFVGNVNPEEVKPLVETWIGGLPGYAREESWKNPGIEAPKGVVDKVVRKGTEPKSLVTTVIHGSFKYSLEEEYKMKAMTHILRIMLRESLREEKGGTYFVRANHSITKMPGEGYKITLGFGCAPENVKDLSETMFARIEQLKKEGPSEKNLEKVKETHRREMETDLKDNGYWASVLERSYREEDDPKDWIFRSEMIESLSAKDVKKAAKKYLNTKNYVRVVLLPEE